jgi:hypothetical protein
MKNSHAIIDSKTNKVRNIVIWEGAEWLPPRDHYVVNNCDGQIGDYWHKDTNSFYTYNLKRRYRTADYKVGEMDLTSDEQAEVLPTLQKVFAKQ